MADPVDDGWARHEAERRRAWRALSPTRRLELLEQAKQFCASYLGAARRASPPPTEEPPPVGEDESRDPSVS